MDEQKLSFMLEGEKKLLANELITAIKKWAIRGHVKYTVGEMVTICEVVTASLFEWE